MWYNASENYGRLMCRLHPSVLSEQKLYHKKDNSIYDCCGYSSNRNRPEYSYLHSWGCTKADHDVNYKTEKFLIKWADDPCVQYALPTNVTFINKETFAKGKITMKFADEDIEINLKDCWEKIKETIPKEKKIENYHFKGKDTSMEAQFKEFVLIRRVDKKKQRLFRNLLPSRY